MTAFWQAWEVYKLDVARTSIETAERRRKNVEDIQKSNTYRIAHGLQDENAQGLGGWTPKSDEEALGSGAKAGVAVQRPVGVEPGQELEPMGVARSEESREGFDKDREPSKKPVKKPVKKWLGIW